MTEPAEHEQCQSIGHGPFGPPAARCDRETGHAGPHAAWHPGATIPWATWHDENQPRLAWHRRRLWRYYPKRLQTWLNQRANGPL